MLLALPKVCYYNILRMMNKQSISFFLAIQLFVALSVSCFSQNMPQQKMLKQLSHAKRDSNQVTLLNDLSMDYIDEGDYHHALKYGGKALQLAKDIKDSVGIAVSYSNLGFIYSYDGKNDEALRMYRLGLECNRRLGREMGVIDAFVNIGYVYDVRSDYRNSLRCYNYALSYAKRKKNISLLADVYQNLGVTYYSLGNLPESLKMHYESLRNYDKLNDYDGKADEYNSIGNVYADQGNEEQALIMYKRSLKLCLRAEDKNGSGNAYVNIGIVYKDLERYQEALVMYDKAIQSYTAINDRGGLAIAYNDKAKLYYKIGRYEEALKICNTSLENSIFINDISEITNSYLTMARIYIKLGKLEKARELIDLSLRKSIDIGEKNNIKEAYWTFVQLDSASNDFKSAFMHQKLWLLYRDSIVNQEAEEKSYNTVLKYAYDKKAIAEQRKHDKVIFQLSEQNKLSSQQRLYLTIILIGLLISALVVWFFARKAYKNRKQLAEVLSNENEHKEVLLQEVHHRVNNSLQMISSLLSIQADTADSEEIREYLIKSENRIQAMSVMHQLLHLGNSKLEVNMSDYFSEVLQFYRQMLESKPGIVLEAKIPSLLFHTKLAMPLALILNELITNSLKYAFPTDTGKIEVSLEQQQNEMWLFRVKDNGIGFDANESRRDSSIGLSLVHLMTKQIDGEITIRSTEGMLVEIRFPEKK